MVDYTCQDKLGVFCEESRKVLEHAKISIVGMGALGTHTAELLVRSGARNIVLFDDDVVESSNLARQTLFTEEDVGKQKVVAAGDHLSEITKLKLITVPQRIKEWNQLEGADILLDCTDNIPSRKIINEAAKKLNIPWVHAAVIEQFGEVMAIAPGSKDYESLMKDKHSEQDCLEQGVLASAVAMTSALQVSLAIRLLTASAPVDCLFRINAWEGSIHRLEF